VNSRIILIIAAIVAVVQVLDILLGVVLGLLAVDEVHALGLSQLVNLSTGETDEELLGELMGDRLSCRVVRAEFLCGSIQNVPSLRCLSSNTLKAPNEAAPARASWPKEDSLTSPLWTWSYAS
jgi:hypothetical protein